MDSLTKHSIYHTPNITELPIQRFLANAAKDIPNNDNLFYSKFIYALNYYFSFPFSLERKPYILAFNEIRKRPIDISKLGYHMSDEEKIKWSTYKIDFVIVEPTLPRYPNGIDDKPTQNFDHVFIEYNWNSLSMLAVKEIANKAVSSITRQKGIFIINVAKDKLWFYVYFKDSGLEYTQQGISGLVLLYPLLNAFKYENLPVLDMEDYIKNGISFSSDLSRFYIHLLFSFISKISFIDNLKEDISKYSILNLYNILLTYIEVKNPCIRLRGLCTHLIYV
jgi:hypothetical protein